MFLLSRLSAALAKVDINTFHGLNSVSLPNNLNNDFIEKFRGLFKKSVFIELSGATGEPLLNPYFIEICK